MNFLTLSTMTLILLGSNAHAEARFTCRGQCVFFHSTANGPQTSWVFQPAPGESNHSPDNALDQLNGKCAAKARVLGAASWIAVGGVTGFSSQTSESQYFSGSTGFRLGFLTRVKGMNFSSASGHSEGHSTSVGMSEHPPMCTTNESIPEDATPAYSGGENVGA